jgi:hypothetical protein
LEVVRQSGDSSLDPFLHMSIPFMRAITAVQHLGPEISQQRLDQEEPPPPTISVSSAALMADAWRGPALPIAAAIDPRVVGTFQAAPFGALPAYFALQQESWASGHSLGDPRDWLSFLESPDGQTYQQRLDPAAWPPELLQGKKMMFSWGTQTTFAPPQSLELYRAALPQDTWSFSVADYEDGITSGLHLPMWQVFLRACDGQRALPQVSATASDNQGNVDVSARVELPEGNQISGVSMIYVQRHREDDDMDFRDAIWQSSELEPKDNGTWNGTFAPLSQHTAVVVQVQDFGGEPGTDAISASTMQTLVLE